MNRECVAPLQNGGVTPLTPNMHAALDLLAASADRAFVRIWSGWWVREGDYAGAHQVGPAHVDVTGRAQTSGAFWAADEEPYTVVATSTIKALANRGLVKFKGPKRLVLAGGAKRKDYHRAELTPAGLQLMADRVERASAAYGEVLQKFTRTDGA